jgi:hypothetical protein
VIGKFVNKMNKALYTRRIELFKHYFTDYKTSENGNFYAYINEGVSNNVRLVSGYNATKNQLCKLGQTKSYETKSYSYIILITPNGKLMFKGLYGRFKNLTLPALNKAKHQHSPDSWYISALADIFFIGRKYDYLKQYPKLWVYKLYQNCASLKEAKIALGLSSISDERFVNLFDNSNDINIDMVKLIYYSDNKYNLVSLIDKINISGNEFKIGVDYYNRLNDYFNMFDAGIIVKIPKGLNSLVKLHDDRVMELSAADLDLYSKNIKFESDTKYIEEALISVGLNDFKKLATPYDMFKEGIIQKHCIGTNYIPKLNEMTFYRIRYNGIPYSIAIDSKDGSIHQFNGYKNRQPPNDLFELITLANKGFYKIKTTKGQIGYFSHKIKDLSIDNPSINDNYPKLKDDLVVDWTIGYLQNRRNNVVDDLPF